MSKHPKPIGQQPVYKVNYKIIAAPSKIDGTGAYAGEKIPARKKLGSLGGIIISFREGRRIAAKSKRITLVEFDHVNKSLFGEVNPNDLRYINHGCVPNTYLRVAYPHVEFYALRDIKKGEELTCNYGETHHDGQLPCRCGAPNCKGFL
jgi:uncharacterized protein